MIDRSLLIAEIANGVERRLACGAQSDCARGTALLVLGDGLQLTLDVDDLEFLARAVAVALPLVQASQPSIPPLIFDDPAPSPPAPGPVKRPEPVAARAGARWSEEEDVILADSWQAGKATSAIAERLKRSESAIIARLIARQLAELRHTRAEKQTERGSL